MWVWERERKRMLRCNSADRGCVACSGQHHVAGNGADFSPVLALETVYGTDAGSKANDDGALRPEKLLERLSGKEEPIRPSVPSDVAYGVERGGNEPFGAPGQCTHIRKNGTETVRPRCICQHKVEMGLGLIIGLRTESC